jgi:hypothetical protein
MELPICIRNGIKVAYELDRTKKVTGIPALAFISFGGMVVS